MAGQTAQKPIDAKTEPGETTIRRVVVGPVAVLPLKSGGERYVYKGALVGPEFTDEGVAHAIAASLVADE